MTVPRRPTSPRPPEKRTVVTIQTRVADTGAPGLWAVGFTGGDGECRVTTGVVPARGGFERTRAETMVGAVAAAMDIASAAGPVALDVVDLFLRMGVRSFLKSVPDMELSIGPGPTGQRDAVAAALDALEPPAPSRAPRAILIATDASIASTGTTAGLGWVVADEGGQIRFCGHSTRYVAIPGDILLGELTAIRCALKAVGPRSHTPATRFTVLSDSLPALTLIRKARRDEAGLTSRYSGNQIVEARAIARATLGLPLAFKWVKGHEGHALNEAADRLAVMARRNVEFAVPADVRVRMVHQLRLDLTGG